MLVAVVVGALVGAARGALLIASSPGRLFRRPGAAHETAAARGPARSVRGSRSRLTAAAAAVWLTVSEPVRRAVGRPERRPVTASMQRPLPFGSSAPMAQQAAALPWDNYQAHPAVGWTVERTMAIYRLAEAGYPREQCDLFDDLEEGNGHARSIFGQRDQAVAGKPYVVQAGDNSAEGAVAAEVLAFALARLKMLDFIRHQVGGANRYGWGASEVDWGVLEYKGQLWIVPVWLANVPARRFSIDVPTNTLRLLTLKDAGRGEDLVAGKWVVTARPGPLARAGLMRTATFALGYIRYGTIDWVIYARKFGLPLVLGKYGDGADGTETDEEGRKVLREAVANFGNDGGGVVPKSTEVTVTAPSGADASKTQGSLIGYLNAELSKLVLGATLTADNAGSGGASYALGEVHASVRWDNITFDAAALEESFRTQLAAMFVHYNGLGCAAPLLKLQVVRDLTPIVRAQVASVWVNQLGGQASATQLSEELGFRTPTNDADKLPGMPTPAAASLKEAA
jgi:phage gp29-like protein